MDKKPNDDDRDGVFDGILFFLGSIVVSAFQLALLLAAIFVVVVVFDEFKGDIVNGLAVMSEAVRDFLRDYLGTN